MKDFVYDEERGQILVGDSDFFHIKNLIALCKGWHKFYPFVGVCLINYLNDERGALELNRAINEEVRNDGGVIRRFRATANSIDIEATYK